MPVVTGTGTYRNTPADAAYQLVSGRYAAASERTATIAVLQRELERSAGSGKAAARAAGVSPTTWRNWAKGRATPKLQSLQKVRDAVRRARLAPARERKIRAGVGIFSMDAELTVSSDTRRRSFSWSGSGISQAHRDEMVDAYLAGSPDRMGAAMSAWAADYVGGAAKYIAIGGVNQATWK